MPPMRAFMHACQCQYTGSCHTSGVSVRALLACRADHARIVKLEMYSCNDNNSTLRSQLRKPSFHIE